MDGFTIVLLLIWLKSVTVGSDFNFYYWYKYGGKYIKWYFNRPQFDPEEK